MLRSSFELDSLEDARLSDEAGSSWNEGSMEEP